MSSRLIKDCTPELQIKIADFNAEMIAAGLSYMITCTSRLVKEQVALFAQGREDLEHVNILRKLAGMWRITEIDNKHKITWTLKSYHLVDLDDGDPSNDQSRAFDIAITKGGRVYYDLKVDVNQSGHPDYEEAGVIGEKVGLVWGGRFKNPDRPHFQLKEIWNGQRIR